MRISEESKAQLEASLPSSEATREKLLAYKQQGGLNWEQLARLANRSRVGIERFSKGAYAQTAECDLLVRRAIEQMFTRYPLQVTTAVHGALYETENIAMLRAWFNHCQQNRALAVVYGPPGSQKTYGLKHLVAEFNRVHLRREGPNRAFYVRSSVRMQPRDLLHRICNTVNAPAGWTMQSCMNGLRLSLRELNVLLVIDEGQHLPVDSLEALRELHDEEPHVGILLAGSHQLRTLLNERAPQLEQWNSRIDAATELAGVSDERAAEIVRAEMPNLGHTKLQHLVRGARVADLYNGGSEYINVRRLFKNMHSTRAALAQKGATQ